MKIPHAIAELVSEFSGLNRTPDFKPVRSATNFQCATGGVCQTHSRPTSGSSTPMRKYSGERRRSVNITVGADQLPTVPQRSPSKKNSDLKFRKNRRKSAPCISNIASSTSLKEKLNKLRSANSSGDEDEIKEEDEDFHVQARKQSTTSYRVA